MAVFIEKRSIRGLAGAAFAAALLFGAFLYAARESGSSESFYARALEEMHAEERVHLAGTPIDVASGVVLENVAARAAALRLAYAKALARSAPLAALPGVDLADFENALEALARTQERLASVQESAAARADVGTHLYPIRFLRALLEQEKARRIFLEDASPETLAAYSSAQRRTHAALKLDIAGFKQSFERHVPEDAPRFATQTRLIGTSDVRFALDALEASASHLGRAVHDREECLAGLAAKCAAAPSFPLSSLSSPKTHSAERGNAMRVILARAGFSMKDGPLIALSQSACVGKELMPLFGFENLTRAGAPLAHASPVLVGDIMLVDITDFADLPFHSYFAERGARYIPARDLTYYSCPDTYADQGRISAVEEVRVFSIRERLSAYAPEENALREAEESLSNQRIVKEADAARYLEEASRLAREGVFPRAIAEAIAELRLSFSTNALGVLHTMRDIVVYEETDLLLSRQGLEFDFGARYLFFVRSAFLSLFMAGNPSLAPFDVEFPPNTLPAEEQPFVSYSSLSPAESEKAVEDMSLYIRVHMEGVRTPL